MSDNFDTFIREQANAFKAEKIDLEHEKKRWLKNLDDLFELIGRSLDAYLKDGTISLNIFDNPLHEDLLGSYIAKKADITVGRLMVSLKPIGTFLIGTTGRVDMIGPRGITTFVIVPPEATQRKVFIRDGFGMPNAKSPGSVTPPDQWVWKISTAPPRITYTTLNEESFRSALMGVMGGVDE